MSELIHGRVVDALTRLHLGHVAEKLDALLSQAARTEPTYLDFLDQLLVEEMGSKQRKRVAMGIQIAHFPSVKSIEDFDFRFQPSVDQKLVRELATGRYIPNGENVLVFGPPGVGKTHLAIALAIKAAEAAYPIAFDSATGWITRLADAHAHGERGATAAAGPRARQPGQAGSALGLGEPLRPRCGERLDVRGGGGSCGGCCGGSCGGRRRAWRGPGARRSGVRGRRPQVVVALAAPGVVRAQPGRAARAPRRGGHAQRSRRPRRPA